MKTITIRKEAEYDIEQAYQWYESKRNGLGEELLVCVDKVLLKISTNSQIYPKVNKNIRRIFIKKFPYCVFYIENENSLIVFAVMHVREKPSNWKNRI